MTPTVEQATGQAAATAMPTAATGAVATNTPLPSPTSVITGTAGLPSTGAVVVITHVSSLVGFQVFDVNGKVIGQVTDLVLNLCEARVVYAVVQVDPSLGLPENKNLIIIPYQALAIKGGVAQAANKTYVMTLTSDQVVKAPTFSKTDLVFTDQQPVWETDVLAFWGQFLHVRFTTACQIFPAGRVPPATSTPLPGATGVPTITTTAVPTATPTTAPTMAPTTAPTTPPTAGAAPVAQFITATPTSVPSATPVPGMVTVYRVALWSELVNAPLQETNGRILANVKEVIYVPETGFIRYIIVQPVSANAASTPAAPEFVPVPLAVLSVRHTLQSNGAYNTFLVLIVDTSVLEKAPAFSSMPDTNRQDWDMDVFLYWGRYVQLTR